MTVYIFIAYIYNHYIQYIIHITILYYNWNKRRKEQDFQYIHSQRTSIIIIRNYYTLCIGYSVSGDVAVLFCTVELNLRRNLVISLFPIVLTTEGGAQPPGFTEEECIAAIIIIEHATYVHSKNNYRTYSLFPSLLPSLPPSSPLFSPFSLFPYTIESVDSISRDE